MTPSDRHLRGEPPAEPRPLTWPSDETLARLEEGVHWRKVRMTPELMQAVAEASAQGPVHVEWHGPDAAGFYVPTIYRRADLDR